MKSLETGELPGCHSEQIMLLWAALRSSVTDDTNLRNEFKSERRREGKEKRRSAESHLRQAACPNNVGVPSTEKKKQQQNEVKKSKLSIK